MCLVLGLRRRKVWIWDARAGTRANDLGMDLRRMLFEVAGEEFGRRQAEIIAKVREVLQHTISSILVLLASEGDTDCREKKIRVLVDPRIVKVFVKGMLIGAIFVQLVPKRGYEEATPDSTGEAGPTEKGADAEMVD
ncbi:hypothetical protein SISNIDRAFT_471667 [Sistotremastrum niveocremeum HHB9708]|uniref:Uncharacterized protein n=2 Tax=Sistotremastraceae TaxID=3402574 RepID=A0A164MD10_9AGAM|nr:hypothetical protein SISNIDRAFT_471667 [Sistotremastrum niveocremeum HHB9708]KZT32256.1 hypothetical protein SISSUDRAFT_1037864 [Sistotremastrum suecicum HHB10207 ss-3]